MGMVTKNSNSKTLFDSFKSFFPFEILLSSFAIVATGIILTLGSILLDFFFSHDLVKILIGFMKAIGLTLFGVGMVSLFMDTKSLRSYFEQRLKNVVLDQSYLKDMSRGELEKIQVQVFKNLTKNMDIEKEDSFFNFMNNRLIDYISSFYREDVNEHVIITEGSNAELISVSTLTYVCRKGVNGIQPSVQYVFDQDEILESLEHEIKCAIPCNDCRALSFHGKVPPNEICPKPCQSCEEFIVNRESISSLFQKWITLDEQKLTDGKDISIDHNLQEYKNCDKLIIQIRRKCIINKDRFQTWRMAYPTKGFSVSITYPPNYQFHHQSLLPDEQVLIAHEGNSFSLQYHGWVLPHLGLVYSLQRKDV